MSNTRPKHSAQDVINAIKDSGGIKQVIADRLRVHRHTLDRYFERYPGSLKAYKDECEREDDYNESVIASTLHEVESTGQKDKQGKDIMRPTDRAVDMAKWRAPKKMRHRGYGDVITNIDPSKLTLEQLERLRAGEDPATVLNTGGVNP